MTRSRIWGRVAVACSISCAPTGLRASGSRSESQRCGPECPRSGLRHRPVRGVVPAARAPLSQCLLKVANPAQATSLQRMHSSSHAWWQIRWNRYTVCGLFLNCNSYSICCGWIGRSHSAHNCPSPAPAHKYCWGSHGRLPAATRWRASSRSWGSSNCMLSDMSCMLQAACLELICGGSPARSLHAGGGSAPGCA
jgi:hypothetical protein